MISGDLKCGNDNCNPRSVGFDSTDDCCGRKTKENMSLSALSRMYSVTAAIFRKVFKWILYYRQIWINISILEIHKYRIIFKSSSMLDCFARSTLFFRVPHSLEACLWWVWGVPHDHCKWMWTQQGMSIFNI